MKYKVRILNPAIGVPITAIDKLDDSWEIVGCATGAKGIEGPLCRTRRTKIILNGKELYSRLIIRKRSKTQCGATTISQVQECTA